MKMTQNKAKKKKKIFSKQDISFYQISVERLQNKQSPFVWKVYVQKIFLNKACKNNFQVFIFTAFSVKHHVRNFVWTKDRQWNI